MGRKARPRHVSVDTGILNTAAKIVKEKYRQARHVSVVRVKQIQPPAMADPDQESATSLSKQPKTAKDRANKSLAHREFDRIIYGGRPGVRCKRCNDPLHGINPTNLKTHLRSCCPEVLAKVEGIVTEGRYCSEFQLLLLF